MKEISSTLIFLGGALITLSLIILFLIFWPVVNLEISYRITGPGKSNSIVPRDTEFGIVVPKIRANAKIIPNVDSYKEKEYQVALTRGVAHAKGTGYPGQGKNIFLFSHSSVDFYNAARYNSIFYLLNKLEKDDKIHVFYKGIDYIYKVREKKLVDAKDVSYLTSNSKAEQLTLMTCWPPGTTFKRLLIISMMDKD